MKRQAALILLVLLTPVAVFPQAQTDGRDTLQTVERPLTVKIERVSVADMRVHDTLGVTLQLDGREISAFDLKIGCDGDDFDIISVLPGRFSDSCRWKIFSARRLETAQKEKRPRQLWQVVAVAELVPDSIRPLCYNLGGETTILRLVLAGGEIARVPDTIVPIFFFWEDCGDNTFSDRSGDRLFMSAHVISDATAAADSAGSSFPHRGGAPPSCISANARNRPQRMVDFYNGAVEFKLHVGDATRDSTSAAGH